MFRVDQWDGRTRAFFALSAVTFIYVAGAIMGVFPGPNDVPVTDPNGPRPNGQPFPGGIKPIPDDPPWPGPGENWEDGWKKGPQVPPPPQR